MASGRLNEGGDESIECRNNPHTIAQVRAYALVAPISLGSQSQVNVEMTVEHVQLSRDMVFADSLLVTMGTPVIRGHGCPHSL